MLHGHIVDEFLDQHRLAYSGAPEQTDLSALGIWFQKIYYFYPCLKYLAYRPLFLKSRRLSIYAVPLHGAVYRIPSVNGISEHIEHPAQCIVAHRHRYGMSRRIYLHATAYAFTSGKHYAAHHVVLNMLGHFHYFLFSGNIYI